MNLALRFLTVKVAAVSVAAILGAMATPSCALAQAYPTRPIRLVVPFPPGGPTDMVGRMLADKLGQALGQAVVVDNKAGAGGTIGSSEVAKSPADGYTLLFGSTSTLAISPSIYPKLNYDPATAFAPVALVSTGQQILVINPALPVANMAQLVEYAKTKPDGLTYSSAGNGTPGHLGGELLKEMTGMQATHIPYKGGAPALQAVLAGEVNFTVDVVPTSLPFIRAGKLKALAVLSARRSEVLPEVPTLKEAGFRELSADFWSGLVAPAGTPPELVNRLNAEVRNIIATKEFKDRLLSIGAESQATTPPQFAALIAAEMSKWSTAAKRANVKAD